MHQIVLISGRICTGKSGLASQLETEFGYKRIRTSEILKKIAKKRKLKTDRISLQKLGDNLDSETKYGWVFDYVSKQLSKAPNMSVVVDNICTRQQLEHFRGKQNLSIVHVHLYAMNSELKRRLKLKIEKQPYDANLSYAQADLIKNTKDIESFKKDADVRVYTTRTDEKDNLVRVAARLGLYSPPNVRCVDVLVGGQYGSEGKGHIAAYLSREYDILVRVGGPNAGHTVSSSSGIYTYHQLPSGAKDTNAKLLLGPGMTIHVESLLKEINDCGVTPERLYIDPQAMIIEESDKDDEGELVRTIASTGSGSGKAASRRILDRGKTTIRFAKDIPELSLFVGTQAPYRGSTTMELEKAYREGYSILLEGTQGSGLSIFHGPYPYVTSRDTNVAGCLAEAGISPSRVRRIIMVIRPTPIRVGNPDGNQGHSSGELKHPTTFREIAIEARLSPKELMKNEKTSTTKRDRKVGWFEWEQFRHACALNAPTDIVLTFADYLGVENRSARRFEQLQEDTIKFIEELERVAQAPVSLINTRFPRKKAEKLDLRTVIDRRNWKSSRKSP